MKQFIYYILWWIIIMILRIKNFFNPKNSGELLVNEDGSITLELNIKNPKFIDVKFFEISKIIPTCAPIYNDELSWMLKKTNNGHNLIINWKVSNISIIKWKIK